MTIQERKRDIGAGHKFDHSLKDRNPNASDV